MACIPRNFILEFYYPGDLVPGRFGDFRYAPGSWRAVNVGAWWVDHTEEKAHPDSVLRLIEHLHVCCLPGDAPGPGGKVRLPDGSQWEITGSAENYSHGFHGWDPGLVVVHARRVAG